MKYYLLSNSAKKNDVGIYPQTTGLVDGYEEFAENSMVNLNSDEFPKFIPDLRFELEEKAILTDIISPSNLDYATGLMMNEKAKNIFEQFRIMNYAFYEAILKVKEKKIQYNWLHIVNPAFHGIDFTNSSFTEIFLQGEKQIKEFKNEEEFEKYYPSITNRIVANKIILTTELKKRELDLLFFPFIHEGLIASEKLTDALINNNITGVKIEEQLFL